MVSKALGHRDIQTTIREYGGWNDDMRDSAIEEISANAAKLREDMYRLRAARLSAHPDPIAEKHQALPLYRSESVERHQRISGDEVDKKSLTWKAKLARDSRARKKLAAANEVLAANKSVERPASDEISGDEMDKLKALLERKAQIAKNYRERKKLKLAANA